MTNRVHLPYEGFDALREKSGSGKGAWTYNRIRDLEKVAIYVRCPDCGRVMHILSHSISLEGALNPSLVCPNDSCGWHVWVVFQDWTNKIGRAKFEQSFVDFSFSPKPD